MTSIWKRRTVGIAGILASVSIASVMGEPQTRPAAPATRPDGLVLRSYSVRELISDSQDFPLNPPNPDRYNGANGPLGARATSGRQVLPPEERLDQIIKLIEDTVAAETWKDEGGIVGSIKGIYPYLLVQTTPDVQKQVAQMLDQLHRDWNVELSIEIDAHWILASAEQVAGWQAGQTVNLDILKDPKMLYSSARAIGRNGQTVSVAGGLLANEVTSVTPVVGTDVSAFQVDTTPTRIGAGLELLPRLSDDRRSLLVDLTLTITENVPGKEVPRPTTQMGNPVDIMNALEKPPRQNQRLAETVRLILGTPKFVGGMTLDPGKPDGKNLCLILTAHVVDPLVVQKPGDADHNKGK